MSKTKPFGSNSFGWHCLSSRLHFFGTPEVKLACFETAENNYCSNRKQHTTTQWLHKYFTLMTLLYLSLHSSTHLRSYTRRCSFSLELISIWKNQNRLLLPFKQLLLVKLCVTCNTISRDFSYQFSICILFCHIA